MDEQTLEPCPFCEGPGHLTRFPPPRDCGRGWYVVCHGKKLCPMYCSTPYSDLLTRSEAIAAWNTRAAHSVMAGKVAELEGVAQQAADALYPFISMIAHAFDEDGRHYWTRDPTEAEAQAALKATNAVSAALAPYPERRSE